MISDLLNYLSGIFNSLFAFFNALWSYLTDNIYDFVVWIFRGFVEYSTLESLKFALVAVNFSWDVAKAILQDLQFAALLTNAFTALPGEVQGLLNICRVPDAISLLVTAMVTKYVLRFIPFLRL